MARYSLVIVVYDNQPARNERASVILAAHCIRSAIATRMKSEARKFASMLAPQEVYKPGENDTNEKTEVVTKSGMPVSREEMTREQKLRRRRREKERIRRTKDGLYYLYGGYEAVSAEVRSCESEVVGGGLVVKGVDI